VRYINAAWGLAPAPDCAQRVNPIGVLRHVGADARPHDHPSWPTTYEFTCQICGRRVQTVEVITAVFDGPYWVVYQCECGSGKSITGITGDLLPEALRIRVDLRHQAVRIQCEIDEQRRAMPSSRVKRLLRMPSSKCL